MQLEFFFNQNPTNFFILSLIGACFGSFINVVTLRLPKNQSIILPSSHCPSCHTTLSWQENLPVISWILLRGRCKHCKIPISKRYPIVELFCSALFTLIPYASPPTFFNTPLIALVVSGCLFSSILLCLTILDIDHFWLPKSICLLGIISGIMSTTFSGFITPDLNTISLTLHHLLAALLGYLFFRLLILFFYRIFRKPALGKGDSNLAALLGSWLGLSGLAITIWLSIYLAGTFTIIGLISGKLKFGSSIPLGPFLSIAGLSVWFFGNSFWLKLLLIQI